MEAFKRSDEKMENFSRKANEKRKVIREKLMKNRKRPMRDSTTTQRKLKK